MKIFRRGKEISTLCCAHVADHGGNVHLLSKHVGQYRDDWDEWAEESEAMAYQLTEDSYLLLWDMSAIDALRDSVKEGDLVVMRTPRDLEVIGITRKASRVFIYGCSCDAPLKRISGHESVTGYLLVGGCATRHFANSLIEHVLSHFTPVQA